MRDELHRQAFLLLNFYFIKWFPCSLKRKALQPTLLHQSVNTFTFGISNCLFSPFTFGVPK